MTKEISIHLDGSWNSRDVAAITGIKPGVLYRSASLANLKTAGQERLEALNITDVIDLRSNREVTHDGTDKLPSALNLHLIPIDAGDVSNLKQTLGPNLAESLKSLMDNPQAGNMASDYMESMYRQIVTNPATARQLTNALKVITNAKGATLIHCTAGKDRTGILVSLVLHLLGVPKETILKDYLYSNNYVETLEKNVGAAQTHSKFMRSVLSVKPEYLEAALQQAETEYSSLDNFLTQNDFLEADVQALRQKFSVEKV